MSSELKIKLLFDASGAEIAADALPNAVDRANRKNRKFGDFTKGYTEIKDGSTREAGRKPAMERTAYEARLEAERQKAAEQAAAEAAKADEDANKWWDQAAARGARKAEQDEKDADRAAKEEERRRKKAEKDAERASKEEEARRKKAEKEQERRNKKAEKDAERAAKEEDNRLKNAEKAAKAGDWHLQFGKQLQSTIMSTLGPAAIAAKAIQLAWGSVIDNIKDIYVTRGLKLSSGVDPMNARAAEVFSGLGTASDDEALAAIQHAQDQVSKITSAQAGADATGFNYFGLTDMNRYREEGLNIGEVVIAMAKRFKEEGGSKKFEEAASSILGPNWRNLGMVQAEAYAAEIGALKDPVFGEPLRPGINKPGDVMSWIEEDSPSKLEQRAKAWLVQQDMIDMFTPGQLMGGLGGNTQQSLSNVTSLQAMGGGDILSAIARGPQDQIVDNTARTATAVEQMAQRGNGSNPQPAIIGR